MQQRIKRHPFLALFDGADPNSSTAERSTTLTPLQALFLINDPFVHEQSHKLAERMLRAGQRDDRRIALAYQLLFGRPAQPSEVREGELYLQEFQDRVRTLDAPAEQHAEPAWASFLRGLFASNEFIFID